MFLWNVYGRFFTIFKHSCRNLAFQWSAGDQPSVPSFSGIFLKFPDFLRCFISNRSATRETTRTSPFDDNNLVPIHLQWTEIVIKREKVYKYFVHDCPTPKLGKFRAAKFLTLTHFRPMFHLCKKQIVGFY